VLKIANSATIAPDVPETPVDADAPTPADETAVPADVDTPDVPAETPANQDGWVEVKPSTSHPAPTVISVRSAVPAHVQVRRAAVPRHEVQYQASPRQYHRRSTKVRPAAHTSSLHAPSQPARSALSRSAHEPATGGQSGDDICTTEPPICPDVCSDDSPQNSVQNVAEIVRCIVNSALGEIGNGEAGSAPDSGVVTPVPLPEPDASGQYQCEDLRYHHPACDSQAPAGSPAAPPTSTPTPDAAPVAPPSGTTVTPTAPGADSAPVGVAAPSNPDDGWELVHESRAPKPLSHVTAAAPLVRSTRVLQSAPARVHHVRVPTHPMVHPPKLSPTSEGRHRVALAPSAGASSGSKGAEWPLRTTVALLALASIALALAALAKVYGGGTAVALRTRLGSKGLSSARRRRPDDERGIRYRG
jgi:hypothetical protein